MKKSLLRNMTMAFKICIIASCFLNVEKTFAQGTGLVYCYKDLDNDGYGDPNNYTLVDAAFFCLYVSNNLDCNDNDREINPNTVWYKDSDNDGLSTGQTIIQCERPFGYKKFSELQSFGTVCNFSRPATRVIDCDDFTKNDVNNDRFLLWFVDNDGDGFVADKDHYIFSCTNPIILLNNPLPVAHHYIGFVSTDQALCNLVVDCNDNDPLINPLTGWYLDGDGDGFPSNNTPELITCQPPPGGFYKTRQQLISLDEDCNDANANIFPRKWEEDKDGDGLITGNSVFSCTQPEGYVLPPDGGAIIDCDDNDPEATIVRDWYPDADGDGYGGPVIAACKRPVGSFKFSELVSINDCNDNNKNIHPDAIEYCNGIDDNCNGQIDEGINLQEWVINKDNDNYYTGNPVTACSSPGEEYVLKGTLKPGDCNDNDETINPETIWYIDKDNDGYHNGTIAYAPSCTPPFPNFNSKSTKGPDCDDNDPAINPETIWVLDKDGDNYYSDLLIGCSGLAGYKIKGDEKSGDCNDDDPAINPGTTWFLDADGDGYSSPTTIPVPSCTSPGPKYILTTKGLDCNDDALFINPQTNWVLDSDLDSYYVGDPITSCTSPGAGYRIKLNQLAGDCDDNNSSINIPTGWYFDGDKDGYYNQEFIGLPSCTGPGDGWVNSTNGPDCNDGDAAVHTSIQYYVDGDKDGYGSTTTAMLCSSTAPPGYSTNNNDCNDNDKSIYPGAPELCDGKDNDCDGQVDEGGSSTYYRDADGDGYGDPSMSTTACTQPTGYVSNNTDCNDNDKTIYPGAPELCDAKDNNCNGQVDEGGNSTYYRDADGDGFGDPTLSTVACTPPTGYVSNNTDCKDNDKTIYPGAPELCDGKDNNCNGQVDEGVKTTFYRDVDGDGYGNPNISVQSCSRPSGYVTNNTDCNDNNRNIRSSQTYYLDADKDGYGNPAKPTTVCSSTQPSGYVKDNTDCNDNNRLIHAPVKYYVDNDRDGYGSQATAMLCAVLPSGYSINNLDCNDNNAAIHPLTAEICGNGIDDNCNGQVDEGCTVCQNATVFSATNITSSSAKLNWTASANPVQWQVDYKKSSSSLWKSVLLSGSARSVTISSLSSNQTYNWRIKALCGKTWTSYSATQTFKTLSSSQTISQQSMSVEVVEEGSSTLKLYPNPNNGQFVIQLSVSNEPDGNAKIQMVDVLGRIVHAEIANLSSGKLQKTVTMPSQVTRGVYMLRIIVNDKAYQTKLIYQ